MNPSTSPDQGYQKVIINDGIVNISQAEYFTTSNKNIVLCDFLYHITGPIVQVSHCRANDAKALEKARSTQYGWVFPNSIE